jgi:hypothetical protein
MRRLTTKQQGDLGEQSAAQWLWSQGAVVAFPAFHSAPDYDLIADLDGELLRVQVKTCACTTAKGHYVVAICTRGGNQSWNGIVKRFSPTRCDRLFVLVGDGRRWFIPAHAVAGTTAVTLGGPKYAAYEVEPGRPFAEPKERDR